MERITCGDARAAFEIPRDGLLRARITGGMSPRNAGAVSARLLELGAERGAIGLLIAVNGALVALPPLDVASYRGTRPERRDIPVAVLISPEQIPIYAAITSAAAQSGAMRRAFLSRAEAEAWLREQAHALAANRAWWSLRR